MSANGTGALGDVVEKLETLGRDNDRVSVHDIREAVGERSFGPFLLIPALIEISPVGGIPGLPTVLAVVIALFAVQILVGRRHLWLPDFIERRSFKGETFAKAMSKMKPVGRWADRVIRPRLEWLAEPPSLQIAAAIGILMAATVPFLEIVPFASTLPMGAVALLGLGLLARDGIVLLLAAAFSLGSAYLVYATLIAG